MVALILEFAFRSLLLGVSIWILLKLVRLRDAQASTAIWTMVLVASVLMPALTILTPLHVAIPLPFHHLTTATATTEFAGNDTPAFLTVAIDVPPVMLAIAHSPAFTWQNIVRDIYCLIALIGLLRLATGLVVMGKLYREGALVGENWAKGLAVRSSGRIDVPITFGSAILLPQDYREWSSAKLMAVLAHERSHIRRGDFFIHLLAGINRALFWFNPFAWWLQSRLSELAETASDDAAIRRLDDPTAYAEILLEVSLKARATHAGVAMAKCPNIRWRVERILSGALPDQSVSLPLRLLAIAALVPVSLTFAGAKADVAPIPVMTRTPPPVLLTAVNPVPMLAEPKRAAASVAVRATRPTHSAKAKAVKAEPNEDNEITYNPRALLDDPEAAILPAVIPVTGDTKGKKQQPAESAFILNLNGIAGSGD